MTCRTLLARRLCSRPFATPTGTAAQVLELARAGATEAAPRQPPELRAERAAQALDTLALYDPENQEAIVLAEGSD